MTGVLERYQQLIIAEELRTDTDQQAAAQRLDALQKELEAAPPRGSTLWKMLRRAPPPPRGLYMWGGVGRGKSMLMDLFFDSLDIRRKRRVHFRSEEHTSELQSLMRISYAVFCLKNKNTQQ